MATRTFYLDISGASSGSVVVEPGGTIVEATLVGTAAAASSLELSLNPTAGTAAAFLRAKVSGDSQTAADQPFETALRDLSVRISENSRIYGYNSASIGPCVGQIVVEVGKSS